VAPEQLGSIALVMDSTLYTHSDAVLRVATYLDFPWSGLRLLSLVPRVLRDFGYAVIARNRYRLSRRRAPCRVNSPMTDSRFLQ
jgi:predicted DCC family thiol-disulfide oxidoreductase YuxK